MQPVQFLRATRKCPVLAYFVGAALLLATRGDAQSPMVEESRLKDRFLAEALPGWEAAARMLATRQGRYHVKWYHDGELNTALAFAKRSNAQCRMYQQDDQLAAYNPWYSFELSRKDSNSPWVLTRLSLDDVSLKKDRQAVDAGAHGMFSCPVRLQATWLRDLIRQTTFRLISVRSAEKNGLSLVEVSFTNRHDLDSEPFCAWQGGKLYLDPARSWCVHEAVLDSQYSTAGGETLYQISLADEPAPSCVPRKLIVRQKGYKLRDEKSTKKEPWDQVTEVVFDIEPPTYSPDNDEFRLAAFGLPEPMGFDRPARSRWYLWLALAAAVLLCVGVWLRKKRRTATA